MLYYYISTATLQVLLRFAISLTWHAERCEGDGDGVWSACGEFDVFRVYYKVAYMASVEMRLWPVRWAQALLIVVGNHRFAWE
jgi:hypothetical protein